MKALLIPFILPLFSFAQDTVPTKIPIKFTSYSGMYKGMNMHGIEQRSDDNVLISNLMTAWSDEGDGLPRYLAHMKKYHPNGNLVLDSTLDLTGKRGAKVIVIEYDSLGTMLSKTELKAKMDPKREKMPKKADMLWVGSKVIYKPEKQVIPIERVDE